MAQMLSVESAQFNNQVIESYTKTKLGPFSKYLEKNPIYLQAYYHIDRENSRVDVGTGGIEHELGPRSPIRFHKILQFPVYNLPELKPEVDYDETGYDIQLDLSDIVVLPNTIRPTPGDYFVVSFPGIKEFLFRVTNFRYNTIQSNDYYLFDADLRQVGENLEGIRQIDTQVTATYNCIFDKIGTGENCFIESADVQNANAIVSMYNQLCDTYKSLYYDADNNSFLFPTGYTEGGMRSYLYDMYLEHFINESQIFVSPGSEKTLILHPNDIMDERFFYIFSRTIWDAILKKNLDRLHPNIYSFIAAVMKRFSVFTYNDIYVDSIHLALGPDELLDENSNSNNLPCGMPIWFSINSLPACGPTWTPGTKNQYFGHDFIYALLTGGQLKTKNYFEVIIYNYLHDIKMDYNLRDIYKCIKPEDQKTYYYLPIVIYILTQQYGSYFKNESTL